MRNKWLLFPILFLLPACTTNASRYIERSNVLYQDQTVDNVKIGDKITVETKTLTYDGQSKEVKGQIILPDGASKTGGSFTIEMPGIYEVRYRAFFGTHEERISIFYHCHRTSGDFFLSTQKDNPATVGKYSHPLNNGEIMGAKLKLDSKTTYTYDGEIDFNSFDFAESFIDFIVDTSKQSTSDLEKFTIRLTDTEDSANYVDITVTDSGPLDDDGRGSYFAAGSNNQYKIGFEGGKNGRKHTANKYGTNVGMSFRDLPEKAANVAKLYFNYQQKELYVSPIINSTEKGFITDLDDQEIYGSTIWNGFAKGTATLSIFANSLLSTSATLIVTKIGNQDLSPLDFVDEIAPSIRVNYNGQSSINIPKASLNKPYKIFDATVSDNFDRYLSYSTYVTYLDEENHKTKDITVNNGYFTPKEVGRYTITYTAKDHSNNYGTNSVQVIATNSDQHMEITLDSDTITQDIFTKVNLPSLNEVRTKITGGSGKPTLQRIVCDGEGNKVEVKDDSFIPNQIGQYKVIYEATDYIGNVATGLINVNVTDPGHPVFIDEFSLPRVLIKGHEYALPTYQGVEVIDGKTIYLDAKIYVNDILFEKDCFTAIQDNCQIEYRLEGQRGTEKHIEDIQVIDCGAPLVLSKYFYGDEFDKEVNKEDVTLSADNGTANTYFISTLPYNNPYVKFAFDEGSINFDELVFKFSDSLDPNNSLSFHVKFKNGKTYISTGNSAEEHEFSAAFENSGETYTIDFNNVNGILKDVYHKEIMVVNKDDRGVTFDGFSNGIYLDISMVGIKSPSSVKLLAISNQPLGHNNMSYYTDDTEPVIIFNQAFLYEQEYGQDAFVPSAEVFDVLSRVHGTISVMAPDETYILEDEDTRKNQTFKIDQFGDYVVTYTAIDDEGNKASTKRIITVQDYVAPELTITGKINETYKLNSKVKIPSYVVKDNLNDYTLDIFLILPDHEQRLLIIDHNGEVISYLSKDNMIYNSSFKVDSNTFRVEQTGHYILRYVAYDSYFNKVAQELHFNVK